MFPYHRLQEIFMYLFQKQKPIHLEDLTATFHVSERTMRSDIQSINSILLQHGGHIERIRKKGFYLKVYDEQALHTLRNTCEENSTSDELDNAQKRIHFLLQSLLFEKKYISHEHILDTLYISRNTLQNYIRTIRKMIAPYHLILENKVNMGLCISGDEESIRTCFMDILIPHDLHSMVIDFTPEVKYIFKDIDLHCIEQLTLAYAKQYEVRFSDFNLRNLILHFALLITRLRMHCPLDYDRFDYEPEYDIEPLLHSIEKKFAIEIPSSERYYIYRHFMSNAKMMHSFKKNESYFRTLVTRLLQNIYENYSFDLRQDRLLQHDLIHHLQSILSTKHYHLTKRNPLLNTIKANYPLAFDIALTCMQSILEDEPYHLSEDEIGYVSLHIGAAIERCFSLPLPKKTVILVCGSGYATSRMMEAKLNTLFHDKLIIAGRYSYNEYQQMHLIHIDFVISTIPIEVKDIPVVLVDFSLRTNDIEKIEQLCRYDLQNHKSCLDEFFDPALFFYFDTKENSKEFLLHTMCEVMKNKGFVQADYEQSVLKRESLATTNLDDMLAIPHPMNLCANKTCVCVAISQVPVKWNEDTSVRLILLLAIKKDERKNIEHLYDTFIQIMNHSKMQNLLLNCTSYANFMQIIHTYCDNEFTSI